MNRKRKKRMSAKLTKGEEDEIQDILSAALHKIILLINEAIDTAYQDGWKDGEMETVERLKK
jgi:hypothetical protein